MEAYEVQRPKSDYGHPRGNALRSKNKYQSPREQVPSNEYPLREGSSLRRKRSHSRDRSRSPGTMAMLVEEKFYENTRHEGPRVERSRSNSLRKRSTSPYSRNHFLSQIDKESRRQSIKSRHELSQKSSPKRVRLSPNRDHSYSSGGEIQGDTYIKNYYLKKYGTA